jgi:hypothetical protein
MAELEHASALAWSCYRAVCVAAAERLPGFSIRHWTTPGAVLEAELTYRQWTSHHSSVSRAVRIEVQMSEYDPKEICFFVAGEDDVELAYTLRSEACVARKAPVIAASCVAAIRPSGSTYSLRELRQLLANASRYLTAFVDELSIALWHPGRFFYSDSCTGVHISVVMLDLGLIATHPCAACESEGAGARTVCFAWICAEETPRVRSIVSAYIERYVRGAVPRPSPRPPAEVGVTAPPSQAA